MSDPATLSDLLTPAIFFVFGVIIGGFIAVAVDSFTCHDDQ